MYIRRKRRKYAENNIEDVFRRGMDVGKSGYTSEASALLDEEDGLLSTSKRDRRDRGIPTDDGRSSESATMTTGLAEITSRKNVTTQRNCINASSFRDRSVAQFGIENNTNDEYGDAEFEKDSFKYEESDEKE